ncbi:hypothetical protein OS189_12855 [Sulfitobacter sp. F26169L]|uniref:hypothetical protein n=1 Tax=Sulfitobacter sp. F26169L TaxID=2996015 RepID=UPI002260FC1A|nr:hypothetical protein [Sulfitobacter sp. F26169L]MCX7567234.1 hypothetical protein [Sulfitobacter sp. F26169L]
MNRAVPHNSLKLVFGAVALGLLIVGVAVLLPGQTVYAAALEGGPIETLSVIGYGVAIVLMLALWGPRATLRRWYFPTMLALFAGRELDLDKRSFTEGLLKSRQYIGETVPLGERILSTVVLLLILAVIFTLIKRETRPFLRGLRNRNAAAYAVLAGIIFIGVFKTLDGLARKLEPFGVTISDHASQIATIAEELGELGIPVLFSIAIILATRSRAVS